MFITGLRLAPLLIVCGGAGAIAPAPAAAQTGYSAYAETPSAALARYVRTLASSPKDFTTLIGAGRAALALGDTQAAAAFFARADEVNPASPLPQAGMGAVTVLIGNAEEALGYFARAQQRGASAATFGADRGLAYDLLGRQAEAQADYRAALAGPDRDEARRRLALSLAIVGDKTGAMQMLAPLVAKSDPATARDRAFVLALTGDSNGAMAAFNSAMPGSWSRIAPFLQRLPALRPAQKAAAVNLGIFPDASGTAVAATSPRIAAPAVSPRTAAPAVSPSFSTSTTQPVAGDRLAGIDELLRGAPAQAAPPSPTPQQPSGSPAPPQATQVASVTPVETQQTAALAPEPAKKRIWLQLASGTDAAALPSQFQRIKARNGDLLEGINGYVAQSPGRARLLIGPFKSSTDAETLAEDLETVHVEAFSWTSSESDTITELPTE